MTDGQHVLLVDGLPETEEVLKAVFEPRGLQIHRISGSEENDPIPETISPSLVVIHSDEQQIGSRKANSWNNVPRVIIGSANLPEHDGSPNGQHILKQPFQYRELIQAIEDLLSEQSPLET